MISVWEVRKLRERGAIERLVSNALVAASLIHKETDIDKWVLASVDAVADSAHRAAILSSTARIFLTDGQTEKGLNLLRAALRSARLSGREHVLNVLAEVAIGLAITNQVDLLWQVYQAMEEVDSWLST